MSSQSQSHDDMVATGLAKMKAGVRKDGDVKGVIADAQGPHRAIHQRRAPGNRSNRYDILEPLICAKRGHLNLWR